MFFVISGFLITAHLVRDIELHDSVRLFRFWARRARRLLPASLLVLLVTAVTVLFVVPRNLWQQFLVEIWASGLYVQNWLLAFNSVDYLAASNVPSPVQHFWTLSVEEQFYVGLPLVLLVVLLATRQRSSRVRRVGMVVALSLVSVASLVYGVILTATDPGPAYFATSTRAWEFAAGSVLALIAAGPPIGHVIFRAGTSWLGLALIGFAGFSYTGATPFPGAAATVPVVGTLMVIWAGMPGVWWAPTWFFRLRPVQFIGDISYSLYLWHWPLLIFSGYAFASNLNLPIKVALLATTVALSALTKRFVEDPVRQNRFLVARAPRWTFGAVAAAMSLVLLVSGAGWANVQRDLDRSVSAAAAIEAENPECFGAAALARQAECFTQTKSTEVVPAPAAAASDRPAIYTDECRSQPADPTVRTCIFGKIGSSVRVALIGDSHAASWFPAIDTLAEREGWELHTFFKATCGFSRASRQIAEGQDSVTQSCLTWNSDLAGMLANADRFDLVFTAMFADNENFVDAAGTRSAEAAIKGFRAAWEPIIAKGGRVVAIRDNPIPGILGFECAQENLDHPEQCGLEQKAALSQTDYSQLAAKDFADAVAIDMTKYFCVEGVCPTVIGGVLVYRDDDHFTATYSRSLAPWLLRQLLTTLSVPKA